jgi:eukaryotic-like serine/threonine-protein kinase
MSTVRRLGKYELQERLGRGGMAEVWKAFDTQLRRYVAIKFLHADFQADSDFVSRFTREAQTVASLHHPNIVQIYDFYISENYEQRAEVSQEIKEAQGSDTIAYMVMEYIPGRTLAHYINETSHKRKFPSAAEVVRLFTPISLALDYAHQHDTIHRDIKPANILLDERNTARNPMGEPILSDFGLAKLLGGAAQTATGTVFGTPLYIAPEQVQNRPISSRTDLYSLGVVLYEIFSGRPPFQGDTLSGIMMQHLLNAPPDPRQSNPQLPPALTPVLMKSMAKNPQDRYPSAAAMTATVALAFGLPVPEELRAALALTGGIDIAAYQTQLSNTARYGSSPSSPGIQASQPPGDIAEAATIYSEPQAPNTVPPATGAVSEPVNLPDSEKDLWQRAGAAPRDGQPIRSMPQVPATPSFYASAETVRSRPDATPLPPPSPLPPAQPAPPSSATRGGVNGKLRIALIALVIIVLAGGGLGAFLAFSHHTTPVANTSVGQAFFVSSNQINLTSNAGSNDEFQISLKNIPAPAAGKSYYAWLLPDKSNSEGASLLLGKLSVNNGAINFLYPGDSQHTNLLGITSQFLITEEDSNVTPTVPSPDQSTWRYYAAIPQTPGPGNPPYSLLDHLRHLLAKDPELQAVGLQGGLNVWTNRNIQQVLAWSEDARNDWDTQNFSSVNRKAIQILDYLDGSSEVAQDVPAGTPIMTDPKIAQIGLLQFNQLQNPPGYLNHIALHLNGVLSSPGSTQYQRQLATQINTGIDNEQTWLGQVRKDAVQLAHMNNTQLAQQSTLMIINDMVTQATNAFNGYNNPSTGKLDEGYTQIYLQVQKLATFDVKPYSKGQ